MYHYYKQNESPTLRHEIFVSLKANSYTKIVISGYTYLDFKKKPHQIRETL